MMIYFLLLIVGLLVGFMAGYVFAAQNKKSEYIRQQEELERHNKESLSSLKSEFDRSLSSLNIQMQAVTEEMLKKRQDEFSKSSGEKMNQILQPLRDSIKEMKDTVAQNTAKNLELGGKLDANLNSLFVQTAATQASADKLANALKGSNQTQGLWGEIVLKELLESQGLHEGTHFDIQTVLTDISGKILKNSEGNIMRPDVILHLDSDRDVIIDSKVSLSAYLDYMNAKDEDSRSLALDKHIRSIENHISELIKKDYSGYKAKGKESVGFVIMFIPNSSALLAATSKKPELWRNALDHKVYIADEQTLYAALKIINLTWQQIAQASNHEKVYELAEEMLDRVGKFMESYVEIGNKLKGAQDSFESGMKKLKEGGQSIPVTCRKLRELGARTSKLPKGVPADLMGQ